MTARKRRKVKMGRPALPVEDRRRHKVVAYLTDSEFAALERIAGEREMALGTALHRLLRRALGRAAR